MRKISRLSTALLFSLLLAFAASAEAASLTSKIKKFSDEIIDAAWQNPAVTTAIAIGVPLVLYLVWPDAHQNRAVAPAAAAFAAAARAVNPGVPPDLGHNAHQPFSHLSEQQMIDHALKLSAAEAKPFQDLDMGAGDYHFNLELFLPFSQIKNPAERVKVLKRVLYEHDQKFTEHGVLVMFAQRSYVLSLQDIVSEFHQLPSSCYRSLLSLYPKLKEIDPAEPPAFNFDELLHEYELVRELRARKALHADALGVLDRRKRQLIEDRILLHVISYFFGPALNDLDYSNEKAALAIEHLFGDAEGLGLAPEAVPAPVQLTEDELRLKRLARFEKNKEEK